MFEIEMNAKMNLNQVESSLGSLQSKLSQLKPPKGLEGEFAKIFSGIDKNIDSAMKHLENGLSTKSGLNAYEKDITEIQRQLEKLGDMYKTVNTKDLMKGMDFDIPAINKLKTQLQEVKTQMSSINTSNVEKANQAFAELSNTTRSNNMKNFGKLITESLQTGDLDKALGKMKEMREYAESNKGMFSQGANGAENWSKLVDIMDKFQASIDGAKADTQQYAEVLASINNEIAGLKTDAFNELSTGLQNGARNAKSLSESMETVKTSTVEAASAQQNLQSQLNDVGARIGNFFTLSNAIDLVKRGLNDVVETVKEIDSSMTETATVTNFSVGDMWDKLPIYTKNAQKLGTTINDVVKAVTIFYQQGLNTDQSFGLARQTLKMGKIAGMDAPDAADAMTSAIHGFQMGTNEKSAKKVNDVYSKIAAITAADTGEIATAMSKTASLAKNAGMDIETTSAYLGKTIEATREAPENIGTALKTVLARFTEIKKDPTKTFHDDSGSYSYNDVDTALQTIGVQMKDNKGNFKGAGKTLDEVSKKWDTLTQAQQKYIATTAAGSRQQSRFIAMVADYEKTQKLEEAAYNSAGAGDEQFNKTLDSMESKINQFKDAWDTFAMTVVPQGAIKGVMNFFTTILNGINDVTNALGPLSGAGKMAVAAFGLKAGGKLATTGFDTLATAFVSNSKFLNKSKQSVNPDKIIREGSSDDGRQLAIRSSTKKQLARIRSQIGSSDKLSMGDLFGGLDQMTNRQVSNFTKDMRSTMRSVSEQLGDEMSKSMFKGMDNVDPSQVRKLAKNVTTAFTNELTNTGNTKFAMNKAMEALTKNDMRFSVLTKGIENEIKSSDFSGLSPQIKNAMVKTLNLADIGEEEGRNFVESLNKQLIVGLGDKLGAEDASQIIMKLLKQKMGDSYKKTDINEEAVNNFKKYGDVATNSVDKISSKMSELSDVASALGFDKAAAGLDTFGMGLSSATSLVTSFLGNIKQLPNLISLVGAGFTTGSAAIVEGMTSAQTAAVGLGATLSAMLPVLAVVGAVGAVFAANAYVQKKHQEKLNAQIKAGNDIYKNYSKTQKEVSKNSKTLTDDADKYTDAMDSLKKDPNDGAALGQYNKYAEEIAKTSDQFQLTYDQAGKAQIKYNGQVIQGNKLLTQAVKIQKEKLAASKKEISNPDNIETMLTGAQSSFEKKYGARNNGTPGNSTYKKIGTYDLLQGINRQNDKRLFGDIPGTYDSKSQKLVDFMNIALPKSGQIKASTAGGNDSILNMSYESLKGIAENKNFISKNFGLNKKSLGLNKTDLNNINQGLNGISKTYEKIQELGKGVSQGIKTEMESVFASLSSAPTVMTNALNEGIDNIVGKGIYEGQSDTEIQKNALDLGNGLVDAWNKNGDKLKAAFKSIQEAQDDFSKGKISAQQYKDLLGTDKGGGLKSSIQALETMRNTTKSTNAELSNFFQEQINNAKNFANEVQSVDLDSIFNPWANKIKSAEDAKSNFEKSTKSLSDYYTASDSMKAISKDVMTKKDMWGEGSRKFWMGAEELLGEDYLKKVNYDPNKVKAQMKNVSGTGSKGKYSILDSGQNGALALGKWLDGLTQKQLKYLEKNGVKYNQKTGDFQAGDKFAEKGNQALQKVLGLSENTITAALNSLRQAGKLKFTDIDALIKELHNNKGAVNDTTNPGLVNKGQALYSKEALGQAAVDSNEYKTKGQFFASRDYQRAKESGINVLSTDATNSKGKELTGDKLNKWAEANTKVMEQVFKVNSGIYNKKNQFNADKTASALSKGGMSDTEITNFLMGMTRNKQVVDKKGKAITADDIAGIVTKNSINSSTADKIAQNSDTHLGNIDNNTAIMAAVAQGKGADLKKNDQYDNAVKEGKESVKGSKERYAAWGENQSPSDYMGRYQEYQAKKKKLDSQIASMEKDSKDKSLDKHTRHYAEGQAEILKQQRDKLQTNASAFLGQFNKFAVMIGQRVSEAVSKKYKLSAEKSSNLASGLTQAKTVKEASTATENVGLKKGSAGYRDTMRDWSAQMHLGVDIKDKGDIKTYLTEIEGLDGKTVETILKAKTEEEKLNAYKGVLKELPSDVKTTLSAAINAGSQGDVEQYNALINSLPEEVQTICKLIAGQALNDSSDLKNKIVEIKKDGSIEIKVKANTKDANNNLDKTKNKAKQTKTEVEKASSSGSGKSQSKSSTPSQPSSSTKTSSTKTSSKESNTKTKVQVDSSQAKSASKTVKDLDKNVKSAQKSTGKKIKIKASSSGTKKAASELKSVEKASKSAKKNAKNIKGKVSVSGASKANKDLKSVSKASKDTGKSLKSVAKNNLSIKVNDSKVKSAKKSSDQLKGALKSLTKEASASRSINVDDSEVTTALSNVRSLASAVNALPTGEKKLTYKIVEEKVKENKSRGSHPQLKSKSKASVYGSAANGANQTQRRLAKASIGPSTKKGNIGPKGKGGSTLVGERGPELVWLPNKSKSFVVGQGGPEVTNLPKEAVVYTARETKAIMRGNRSTELGSASWGDKTNLHTGYDSGASTTKKKTTKKKKTITTKETSETKEETKSNGKTKKKSKSSSKKSSKDSSDKKDSKSKSKKKDSKKKDEDWDNPYDWYTNADARQTNLESSVNTLSGKYQHLLNRETSGSTLNKNLAKQKVALSAQRKLQQKKVAKAQSDLKKYSKGKNGYGKYWTIDKATGAIQTNNKALDKLKGEKGSKMQEKIEEAQKYADALNSAREALTSIDTSLDDIAAKKKWESPYSVFTNNEAKRTAWSSKTTLSEAKVTSLTNSYGSRKSINKQLNQQYQYANLQKKTYQSDMKNSLSELSKLAKNKKSGYGNYWTYDKKTGAVQVNNKKLEGIKNSDKQEQISSYIEKAKTLGSTFQAGQEGLQSFIDKMAELKKQIYGFNPFKKLDQYQAQYDQITRNNSLLDAKTQNVISKTGGKANLANQAKRMAIKQQKIQNLRAGSQLQEGIASDYKKTVFKPIYNKATNVTGNVGAMAKGNLEPWKLARNAAVGNNNATVGSYTAAKGGVTASSKKKASANKASSIWTNAKLKKFSTAPNLKTVASLYKQGVLSKSSYAKYKASYQAYQQAKAKAPKSVAKKMTPDLSYLKISTAYAKKTGQYKEPIETASLSINGVTTNSKARGERVIDQADEDVYEAIDTATQDSDVISGVSTTPTARASKATPKTRAKAKKSTAKRTASKKSTSKAKKSKKKSTKKSAKKSTNKKKNTSNAKKKSTKKNTQKKSNTKGSSSGKKKKSSKKKSSKKKSSKKATPKKPKSEATQQNNKYAKYLIHDKATGALMPNWDAIENSGLSADEMSQLSEYMSSVSSDKANMDNAKIQALTDDTEANNLENETWESPYNAVTESQTKEASLAKGYDRASDQYDMMLSDNVSEAQLNANIAQRQANIEQQKAQVQATKKAAQDQIAKINSDEAYAGFSKYASVDAQGNVTIDYNGAQAAFQNDPEGGAAFEEYVNKLKDAGQTIQESDDSLANLDKTSKELNKTLKWENEYRKSTVGSMRSADLSFEISQRESDNDIATVDTDTTDWDTYNANVKKNLESNEKLAKMSNENAANYAQDIENKLADPENAELAKYLTKDEQGFYVPDEEKTATIKNTDFGNKLEQLVSDLNGLKSSQQDELKTAKSASKEVATIKKQMQVDNPYKGGAINTQRASFASAIRDQLSSEYEKEIGRGAYTGKQANANLAKQAEQLNYQLVNQREALLKDRTEFENKMTNSQYAKYMKWDEKTGQYVANEDEIRNVEINGTQEQMNAIQSFIDARKQDQDNLLSLSKDITTNEAAITDLSDKANSYVFSLGTAYNSQQQLNDIVKKREKLENEYTALLNNYVGKANGRDTSITALASNIRQRVESYFDTYEKQQSVIEGNKEDLRKFLSGSQGTVAEQQMLNQLLTKQGKSGKAAVEINAETGDMKVNNDALKELVDGNTDVGNQATSIINQLSELSSNVKEASTDIQASINAIGEMYDQAIDNLASLSSSIYSKIVDNRQYEIEKLSSINDSINNANSEMFDNLSKAIDKQQQERDNKKQADEISKQVNQLAYMMADTSGANRVEIKNAQKALQDSEEQFQDTLINQKLTALQQQNDKAQEFRARQVNLLTQQLATDQQNGSIAAQTEALIASAMSGNGSMLAKFLTQSNDKQTTQAEQEKELNDWNKQINESIGDMTAGVIKSDGKMGDYLASQLNKMSNNGNESRSPGNNTIKNGTTSNSLYDMLKNLTGTENGLPTNIDKTQYDQLINQVKEYSSLSSAGLIDINDIRDQALGSALSSLLPSMSQTEALTQFLKMQEQQSGDTSYEININVDKLNATKDDLDKISSYIEKKITSSANYRNVTGATKSK